MFKIQKKQTPSYMLLIDWFTEWLGSPEPPQLPQPPQPPQPKSSWASWLPEWSELFWNNPNKNLQIHSWYARKMNRDWAQTTFFCHNVRTSNATSTVFIPLCFDENQKKDYNEFLDDISNNVDTEMTWKILSHRPFQEISLKYSSTNDSLFYEIANLYSEGDYPKTECYTTTFGDINAKYLIANGTLKKNWKATMLNNIFNLDSDFFNITDVTNSERDVTNDDERDVTNDDDQDDITVRRLT